MLTEDHLCSLILAFGEDVLCNICADHPRYRNFFSDRVEMGLGLCCEAAARQTVNRTEPYKLRLVSEEPGGTPLTETEKIILSFREKLASILQQKSIPYKTKEAEAVTLLPPFQWPEEEQERAFLSDLERLDPSWNKRLALLQTPMMSCSDAPERDRALSQLAVSFLFRHLPDAGEDGLLSSRTLFSLWSVRLIERMTRTDSLDELADTARAYSAEIEYSDDNLKACFSYLENCFL